MTQELAVWVVLAGLVGLLWILTWVVLSGDHASATEEPSEEPTSSGHGSPQRTMTEPGKAAA